ncbi:MAG: alpha-galactosidase, partial [Lentisphaerae bacterium]|nr:alpha-galactosidase [Lentisphaerota bacterium]
MTPLRLAVGHDVLALLEEHGELFLQARPLKPKPVCRGWNSWDYFTGSVSADDMYSNMRAARRLFGNRLKYLVIDAGWEPRWGDWVPNWKFPSGLRVFCRKTRAAGMIPGIWTAPALVNRYTRLYRDHPEWFARDAAHQVASETLSYGPMSYLDITHPEARQWVFDTYRRLRREGFEYFKVDFTQRILKAKFFHDPTVGRGQLIRLIFSTIRQAIGDDAYLLSCGAPFQSVTGLVDAARVSDDIHNYWSHVLANTCDISSCWWLHRRAWNNDPDFAIARTRTTASSRHLNSVRPATPFAYKPVWMNGREMNQEEMRCYLLLIYLSAGELFMGDDLPGLKPNGVAMLRRLMQRPLRQAARPLDLFESHAGLPSRFLARELGRAVLGLFNWEEDPAEHCISLRDLGLPAKARIRDFWT